MTSLCHSPNVFGEWRGLEADLSARSSAPHARARATPGLPPPSSSGGVPGVPLEASLTLPLVPRWVAPVDVVQAKMAAKDKAQVRPKARPDKKPAIQATCEANLPKSATVGQDKLDLLLPGHAHQVRGFAVHCWDLEEFS